MRSKFYYHWQIHPGNYLDLTFYDQHAVWSLGAGDYKPQGVEAYALSLGPATAVAGEWALDIGEEGRRAARERKRAPGTKTMADVQEIHGGR